jgi:hypothetical protein
MVGEETLAGRAFVREDGTSVVRCARALIERLPECDTAELEDVLLRYRGNTDRAIDFDGVWQRSTLHEAIRRDLFDLLRYALVYRDPELGACCGRALANIDRRAQTEASPAFDCAA